MTDAPKNGHEFLHRVLAQPSDEELVELVEALVRGKIAEDTWLDYKGGEWTLAVDSKPAKDELRRDLTAFANSEGGCLVVGVPQEPNKEHGAPSRPERVEGCHGDIDGAVEVANAVSRNLAGLALPPPRAVRRVTFPDGRVVLIIAVPRSGRLVPVRHHDGMAHFFRIGDGKQRAPEYLVADLMFGRREGADLRLRLAEFDVRNAGSGIVVNPHWVIENHSAAEATRVQCGVVFWTSAHGAQPVVDSHPIHGHVSWLRNRYANRRCLHHVVSDWVLPPFGEGKTGIQLEVAPDSTVVDELTCTVAVWASAAATAPRWWEIRWTLVPWLPGVKDGRVEEVWDRLPQISVRTE